MTIWLVGMMGSGKTTAGSLAADLLDIEYIDLDDEIVAEEDRTVAEIWEDDGEDGFRELESAALRRVAGAFAVVGTGGGAVLDSRNRELMESTGKVIWLEADPAVLASRVGNDSSRPLLEGVENLAGHLGSIELKRHEAYDSVAHARIDTSSLTQIEVAERISKL